MAFSEYPNFNLSMFNFNVLLNGPKIGAEIWVLISILKTFFNDNGKLIFLFCNKNWNQAKAMHVEVNHFEMIINLSGQIQNLHWQDFGQIVLTYHNQNW